MLGSLATPSLLGGCASKESDKAAGVSFAMNYFKVSEGDLRLPLGIAATVSGTREITLTWDTEKDRIMGKTDDRLHVLLMAGDGSFRTVARDNLAELRGDGQAVVRLTPEEGLPEHLYCFWESANGQNFSPSKHIHIIWE